MRSDRADAVVVGAGVVGTAVAYYLAKAGLEVVVLEQTGVATGSTGHGHGVISLVGNDFKPGPHAELGVVSARLYPRHVAMLEEETGLDTLYHELPGLSLALLEEEEAIFRESMQRLDGQVEMEWLDGDACRALEPRLAAAVRGGVGYRHAQVDASALTVAQVRAVERLGGRVEHGRVTSLQRSNGKIVGVRHASGTISSKVVVLATGAWLGAVAPWVGLRLPIRPLHGEVLHMRIAGKPLELFLLTARHGPILPRRDGLLLVGSIGGTTMSGADVERLHSFDPLEKQALDFDVAPRPQNRDFMLDQAARVLPVLADSHVVAHLAGVRPLSPDRMPLLGPVPGLDGVLIAGGHGTKGIHLAPVTGTLVADLVQGHQPEVAITPFAPERFTPEL